jgi:hypothetical protein
LLLLVVLAGCADDAPSSFEPPAGGTNADGPEHIHGIGINPADDALMIATHSGLFRAPPGAHRAERVGDRRQDTMGFTVVGPDHFLGSGHPDLRDDLPPLLGLIESTDAGRTWQPVSLLGKADFHVLRSAGTRVYGVNAADGEFLVSDDGGRRWEERSPSTALLDVAVSPEHPNRLVASGEEGMFASSDAGVTWRPLARRRLGLLAWPRTDELFQVDSEGGVHRSRDGGTSWRKIGDAGRAPAAFAAYGSELYAAFHTNEVKMSSDGGRSWRFRLSR